MRVFITGGSGFIGGYLVRTLLAAGHEVICMTRTGQASARLAELGAGVVSGDLTDPVTLDRCLREATPTHVAHLAATSLEKSEKACHQVNVEGTRALLDACRPLELERFLFVSSVLRGSASGETFTEDDHIPATTPLGRSKEVGDRMVFDAFSEQQFPGVVLRPSRVYGPGGWLARVVSEDGFRLPGDGNNWWDMVHVEDVANACVALLERGVPGEAYHVCDDSPITMKKFFGLIADCIGRKPFRHVPGWLSKVVSTAAVPAPTRSARSSNDKLKQLGWQLRYPASADAIGDVVRDILGGDADSAASPATDNASENGRESDQGDREPGHRAGDADVSNGSLA